MPNDNWWGKVLRCRKRVVAAYQRIQENKRLLLQQRRQGIIERTEQRMTLNANQRYYVDNLTAQCLRDIATMEGRRDAAPRADERLSQWQTRAAQREYFELAQYLKGRLESRYAELIEQKKEADQRATERRYKEYEEWLSQSQNLVDMFLEIADRKVSQLDDYGDENWDALPKEIRTCLLKIAKTERDNGVTETTIKNAWKKGDEWMVPEKYQWLKVHLESELRKFHNQRARHSAEPVFDELSGMEFETYLARLLKQNGFENIRGTAASGDQGADLLATKGNRTIVIQAKRYRGAVGNKAVQEVVAAVKF